MRIDVLLFALLSSAASLAASRSLAVFGNDQVRLDASYPVPGKNPLTYCANPNEYILNITYVDLKPNPPESGTSLKIAASGVFREDVEPGAKVALTVKYGLITLIHQTANLCDQIANVDLKCPLKKGKMSMTHEVKLPKEVPPGKYTVIADVVTKDGKQVTCLESVVHF